MFFLMMTGVTGVMGIGWMERGICETSDSCFHPHGEAVQTAAAWPLIPQVLHFAVAWNAISIAGFLVKQEDSK